tara:strand:+ start:1613 stop:1846 length:234 start_codon:yes stop_codon:yes gene_type:complete
MTATAISSAWIAEQDLPTLCDLAGIQPANLAIELGIKLATDDYSPMIDSLFQTLGIDPDTAEPHLDRWLEELCNYFW